MKTQVSIVVKDNIFSRPALFLPAAVKAYVDPVGASNPDAGVKLKGGRTPHLLELSPGAHVIYFEDAYGGWKRGMHKLTWGMFGMCFGLGVAGSAGMLMGEDFANLVPEPQVRDNAVAFALQEGQTLRLSVSSNIFGKVKIKVLDK